MYESVDFLLHRVRFFIGEFSSINCIAYNEKSSKVALLRRRIHKYQPSQADRLSNIEIWNLQNKASFLEQVIYDDSDNLNLLEDIVWSKSGRLFSCGLNTYLNEYDLDNGQTRQSYCVNSNPAWCLAIDKNDKMIAVGTEDGMICVYKIYDDCLQYDKVLDKTDKRILCLQWFYPDDNPTSPLLIGGSIDFIKIWSYQSGRCTDFIKVGNTGVVVWCLTVLKDFTIVSGDSTGTTSFWNGKMASMVASYKAHKGDVLSVCATVKEDTVYSSGVDPVIQQFRRSMEKMDSWTTSSVRRPHSHDIRALVYTKKNWLLSGGIDSTFSQSCYPPLTQINHLQDFSQRVATFSDENSSFICLQYEKMVQIWKLGSAETGDQFVHCESPNSVSVSSLRLVDKAVKLLDIKSRKPILSFDFNSEWVVYSNYTHLKVVTWSEVKLSVERVKLLHDPIANITNIRIISGNRFIAAHGKTFEVFRLDKFGVMSEYCKSLDGRIHRIVSTDTQLIISVADKTNTILIFGITSFDLLASYQCLTLPTTIKVNQLATTLAKLWMVLANGFLIEYDLTSFAECSTYSLSKLRSNQSNDCKSFNEHWPIKQIAFGANMVLLSDDNSLYSLNISKNRITKCEKYRHIVFMDNIQASELVVVEITPEMVFNMLPPTMATKSFGT